MMIVSPENEKVLGTESDRDVAGSGHGMVALLTEGQKLGTFKLEELVRILRWEGDYL